MKKLSLEGQVFGRLTAIHEGSKRGNRRTYTCRCTCGNTGDILVESLRSGKSISCGCYRQEITSDAFKTHGETGNWRRSIGCTPEYRAWKHAKGRCHTPSDKKFAMYGGRGIIMCERWRNSYETFLSDMGRRPEGTSLDRIDVNGNYEPNNCRWATPDQQVNNKQDSIRMSTGETLKQFAVRTGQNYKALHKRLRG